MQKIKETYHTHAEVIHWIGYGVLLLGFVIATYTHAI